MTGDVEKSAAVSRASIFSKNDLRLLGLMNDRCAECTGLIPMLPAKTPSEFFKIIGRKRNVGFHEVIMR